MTKQSDSLTGAKFIAETLKGYGVTHVFYVEAMLRMAAAEMERLGITRVITHSEMAAAYMADGYARAGSKPGVCMAQSVGAANLAAGLQDAYLGSSPVIALTGKKPPIKQMRNAYQEVDHRPLFDPVTVFNTSVDEPQQLPGLLRQAFREALSSKPRPVHLDLRGRMGRPIETAVFDPADLLVEPAYRQVPVHRPAAPAEAVKQATVQISTAERPVIVAGGGARLSGAGDAILALARKAGIPVVTSVTGKGVIPENDPLWAGIVGGYSMAPANQTVNRADLVIFIGSGTGDQTTLDWSIPRPGTAVIQIDIDPRELGRNYPGAAALWGDARTVVEQLVQAVSQDSHTEWLAETAHYLQVWYQQVKSKRFADDTPIRPERLCHEIEKVLPRDAVVVSDTGNSAIWSATMLRITQSEQKYLRAAGSLGWAFPASLGAKCACPDQPVVCFCGDGAFYYYISELETARRYGINTVTVVNNNQGYTQGLPDILAVYENYPGEPESLYRFEPVNISRVAQAFGCRAVRVEDPADLGPVLQQAMQADDAVVVEVITDPLVQPDKPWLEQKEA